MFLVVRILSMSRDANASAMKASSFLSLCITRLYAHDKTIQGKINVMISRNIFVTVLMAKLCLIGSHCKIPFSVVSPNTKNLGRPNAKHDKTHTNTMMKNALPRVIFSARGCTIAWYLSKLRATIVQTETPVKMRNDGRDNLHRNSSKGHEKHSLNTTIGNEKSRTNVSETARLTTK